MNNFKQPVLILSPVANISYSQARLKITFKDNSSLNRDFPVRKISSISVYSPSSLSAHALNILLRLKIPCNYFSYYGKFLGRICSANGQYEKSVLLLNNILINSFFRLSIAKYLLSKKVEDKLKLYKQLLKNNSSFNSDLLNKQISMAIQAKESIKTASNISVLLGIEGSLALLHIKSITLNLKSEQEIFYSESRSYRPPLDRFNSLLSFLYSLLLGEVIAVLNDCRIPISIGVIHSSNYKFKPAFALDFMEQFRISIAEKFAIRLINLKQISSKCFDNHKFVYLNYEGRKLVATNWLKYLNNTQKNGCNPRRHIRNEAIKLKKLLKSNIDDLANCL